MVVCCVLAAVAVASVAPTPPHIVMFVSDDQGYHDMGFNNANISTPHLLSLASKGRILRQVSGLVHDQIQSTPSPRISPRAQSRSVVNACRTGHPAEIDVQALLARSLTHTAFTHVVMHPRTLSCMHTRCHAPTHQVHQPRSLTYSRGTHASLTSSLQHYVFKYCSPTRGSLLSGRLPYHAHQWNLDAGRPGGIHRNFTLLPAKLKACCGCVQ
jgi:hypothetical protein